MGLVTLAAETQQPPGGIFGTLLPFVLIIVVFYLLFWRPQQKRRQQEQQMQSSLAPGSEVLTKAGLFGTIVEVRDDQVELEIAPGTRVRMVKAGIAEVIDPKQDIPPEDRPDFPTGSDDKGDDGPKQP
ncbi:preprotein translocase subunit YajC [Salinactinospora qingdaonensis]|uniref:Preprotein translocase subunit YajC n=1 Tax=Salinactinospora qingdaonensis TaxID=702744 RepID=A0ABP7FR62_9ACTN